MDEKKFDNRSTEELEIPINTYQIQAALVGADCRSVIKCGFARCVWILTNPAPTLVQNFIQFGNSGDKIPLTAVNRQGWKTSGFRTLTFFNGNPGGAPVTNFTEFFVMVTADPNFDWWFV